MFDIGSKFFQKVRHQIALLTHGFLQFLKDCVSPENQPASVLNGVLKNGSDDFIESDPTAAKRLPYFFPHFVKGTQGFFDPFNQIFFYSSDVLLKHIHNFPGIFFPLFYSLWDVVEVGEHASPEVSHPFWSQLLIVHNKAGQMSALFRIYFDTDVLLIARIEGRLQERLNRAFVEDTALVN